jgi:hypothetical protein
MQDEAKYPSTLIDRDTSTISTTKRSYEATSLHEDQLAGRPAVQAIHLKLLDLNGDDNLSYSEVCHWS